MSTTTTLFATAIAFTVGGSSDHCSVDRHDQLVATSFFEVHASSVAGSADHSPAGPKTPDLPPKASLHTTASTGSAHFVADTILDEEISTEKPADVRWPNISMLWIT